MFYYHQLNRTNGCRWASTLRSCNPTSNSCSFPQCSGSLVGCCLGRSLLSTPWLTACGALSSLSTGSGKRRTSVADGRLKACLLFAPSGGNSNLRHRYMTRLQARQGESSRRLLGCNGSFSKSLSLWWHWWLWGQLSQLASLLKYSSRKSTLGR